MNTQGLTVVTMEEFFAAIGPLDVHPRSERDCNVWETRSRVMVGKSTPGYMNGWTAEGEAPKVYMLTPSRPALAKATGKIT